MPNWVFARGVVESKDAENAVDQYSKELDRFEEAFEALKWLLARRCDNLNSLKRVVGGVTYHLYRQASDELAGTPSIVVVFAHDDDEVEIIDVYAEPPETDID